MGSQGYVLIREIKDREKWEEIKEEFYGYIKRYSENELQIYEYDNFIDSNKKVIVIYKGDCPSQYGSYAYLVFPELFDIDKEVEEYKEIMKEIYNDNKKVEKLTKEKYKYYFEFKDKFLKVFGKYYIYKIWT